MAKYEIKEYSTWTLVPPTGRGYCRAIDIKATDSGYVVQLPDEGNIPIADIVEAIQSIAKQREQQIENFVLSTGNDTISVKVRYKPTERDGLVHSYER